MRESFELKVHLDRDEDTGRWFVSSSDIPGLWLEADNPVALMERIASAAPELIELNLDEIVESCRARQDGVRVKEWKPTARPSIRPVFDSPLELAYV
ncbi:MAG: hypothetical protein DI623_01405 [Sphingomonas sanxanigenens]|uniref:DUF1902 domain-containing protein n=1 Tax=Sphingomonas sanxanigenens TaxID=397260 RepID=A0A2W5CA09_9SPHN|nr:MAG: hypothetical protein DI623_01405 [Sphingomonas sanxanigenens]